MNKILVSILVASGLLIMDIPEAAAHPASHNVHRSPTHYHHVVVTRTSGMPRWLKEDRSFRHWYKHSRLQRNPYLSWNELFDIYRWEHPRHSHRRGHDHKYCRH